MADVNSGRQAWWARLALVLAALGAVGLVTAAGSHGLWLFLLVTGAVVVLVAAAYSFLALRGWRRTASLVVVLAVPLVMVVLLVRDDLLLPLLGCAGLFVLAVGAGRVALTPQVDTRGMPEREVPPPRHPFIVMNPRSGGGKVVRFDLQRQGRGTGRRGRAARRARVCRRRRAGPGRRRPRRRPARRRRR